MTSFYRRLERIFPWLLLLPVLLPVVISGGVIYPYLVPKTLSFYAVSLLSVAAFILLMARGTAFYWARLSRRELWLPGAFLVVAYVASIVGIDFYRSFWSLFIRGDGLLMLTCAAADFYLIVLSADRVFSGRLMRGAALIGSAVAIYGIGEWLMNGGRIGSLLGNAAFFAGYLALSFFITLIVAPELSEGWRKAAYTGAVLQVIAIILSATRGTMLALLVSALAYLAYEAWKGEGKKKRTSAWILAAIVIVGGLFVGLRGQLANVPFSPVARIASVGLSDPDIANRLFVWKGMVGQIEKSPWIGVGAEHVSQLFDRFYDPTQISEEWFDRSHNAFLDYFAQYGIAGFLLYIGMIAALFLAARRLWTGGEKRTGGLLTLLALTYAVQNFFIFDTISSFWLFLALLAVFLSLGEDHTERIALPVSAITRFAVWPVAAVLVLLIWPVSVTPARAAYDLAQAYKYALVDVPQETAYIRSAELLGTYGDLETGYEAYDMYANYQAQYAGLSASDRTAAYQAAEAVLAENFRKYPYDARTALELAEVLSLAPQGVSVDTDLLSSAIARAIQESPKRAQAWLILANLSISSANQYPAQSPERTAGYAAATDILNRYLSLVPTYAQAHYVLAQLLYASGRTEEAAAEAAKGKADYKSGDLSTARRAIAYYETVLDLPDAAYFLEELLRGEPENAGAKADLEKIQAYEQSQH